MSRGVFSGSPTCHFVKDSPTNTLPITYCAWLWITEELGNETILSLATGDNSIYSRIYGWYLNGYLGDLRAVSASYNNYGIASVSMGGSANWNKWLFVAGVFLNDDSRTVYFWDGSTMASNTDTTSRSIGYNKNKFSVGVVYRTRPPDNWSMGLDDGYVSRISFWNAALNATELEMIARGCTPLKIRPTNLIYHVPMIRDINIINTGEALTEVLTVPHFHSSPPAQVYSSVPHSA